MTITSIYESLKTLRSQQTGRVSSLPVVVLMPHSACNCRCVMCDIWKGNHRPSGLTEADIISLLTTFRQFGTRQVLMSGGEALLNPLFFRFCEILKQEQIKISLLSTGISVERNAKEIAHYIDELIVSLDGPPQLHNQIRNIPRAFEKMAEGIKALRTIDPGFRVTARTVIHRLNFREWPAIINTALELGLNRISFLPADVSSQAFNREQTWERERQEEILIPEQELPSLQKIIHEMKLQFAGEYSSGFIAESPGKIQKIYDYYAAQYGLCAFPFKKCNAPWVSAVVEADGSVRPCFFYASFGNIHDTPMDKIVNGEEAIRFRKQLQMDKNETCIKCVCYLYLASGKMPG